DRAGGRGVLLRLDRVRNGRLPAGRRAGGGRRGRARPEIVPAASSESSVFLPGTLVLKPAFEHISPETPMPPPIPDSKCARYGTLCRMAAQGSGRYAECSCGLR